MLEPTGPLPPEVYWRRRLVAIGALVVVLVLLVWLIVSVSSGGDSNKDDASVAAASTSADVNVGVETTEPAGESGSEAPRVPETPDAPATETAAGPPVPAGQCPDQSLAIKVSLDQPTYQVGQRPQIRIVITNISSAQCQRDLNPALIQALVYTIDGQHRIWSNADCYNASKPDLRNLKPGEQAFFTVNWSGSTSQPGCAGTRVPAKSGAYNVVGQFGVLRSAPEPFNIVPAH